MIVRARKAASPERRAVAQPQPQASVHTFPAPTRGLVQNENLAAVQPGSALVLDNWICTTTGVRPRGGSLTYATLSASGAVTSLFAYKSGASELLFAATAADLFDITTVADPNVIPTAAVSGRTGGEYSAQQFGTAGGNYLYAVNGADDALLFDGTTWTAINGASTPSITGVSTASLSHVWSFANRLFFIEKDSMNAWYLPVDSIGGAAARISLAGVMKRGGSLLFGATWSLDAGDGLDDKCVFVSTEGEIAVYQGTNPTSAGDWALAGVYQITQPMGARAVMQAGGDLLVATAVGLVPLSEAIRRDVAALSLASVSARIEPQWRSMVSGRTAPWGIVKWPEQNVAVVIGPESGDSGPILVTNLQTGGWSRFTGISARCAGHYAGYVYVGGGDGKVRRLETGGSDDGTPYTCVFLGNHESLGAPGRQKTVTQARAVFRSGTQINPLVSAQVDYASAVSPPPNAAVEAAGDLWDVGLWDVAVWDSGGTAEFFTSRWSAVGRTGFSIAPEVQLTFGGSSAPAVELVSIEATFNVGAIVA